VPDDIAIVGAGDIALGDLLVLLDGQLVARSAGRKRLGCSIGLVRARRQFQSVVIPPRLIVRQSSGG
jgi:hypothetical protein